MIKLQKLIILLALIFLAPMAKAVNVEFDITWPAWASENKIEVYDRNDNLVATICGTGLVNGTTIVEGVGACFTSSSAAAYSGPVPISIDLPAGNDYYFKMFDLVAPSWDGTDSLVITVDGFETFNASNIPDLETFGATGSGNFYFSVSPNFINPTGTPVVIEQSFAGRVDHVVDGGTLRAADNTVNACSTVPSSTAALAGIAPGGTVIGAFLYWAGSGRYADTTVNFDGTSVTADQTFREFNGNVYFYKGFADVTSQVAAKGNGNYSFSDLDFASQNHPSGVDAAGTPTGTQNYCTSQTVLGAWGLIVVYDQDGLEAATIGIYNGFDIEQAATNTFTLTGFRANASSGAKVTFLSFEGDETLDAAAGGFSEQITFNGNILSDGFNPANNIHNSSINSLGSGDTYGIDMDSFDTSAFVSEGDTTATVTVSSGQDLVILSSVVIEVGSNIIEGHLFEDINYGGGVGRNMTAATGVPIPDATIELYDSSGNFLQSTTTDTDGFYQFTGFGSGDSQVRVVNDTVRSTRTGGAACINCIPVQTYRVDDSAVTPVEITDEVGGKSPADVDAAANSGSQTLAGLEAGAGVSVQSLSTVSVLSEQVDNVDFGFNFNTIVNGNSSGQGSLEQFIINSNALGNTGLDQVANSLFDPAAGFETSIFMIPSNADPLSRTQDPNFDVARGVAQIGVNSALSAINDGTTAIDGRTQTANIGNTNALTLGDGTTLVGVISNNLSLLEAPEIEIRNTSGGAIDNGIVFNAVNGQLRNTAVLGFGNVGDTANVKVNPPASFVSITNNIIGTPADTTVGAVDVSPRSNLLIEGNGGSVTSNIIGYAAFENLAMNSQGSWVAGSNILQNAGASSDTLEQNTGDNFAIRGGSGSIFASLNIMRSAGGHGLDINPGVTASLAIIQNSIENNGTAGSNLHGIFTASPANIFANRIYQNAGSGVSANSVATNVNISQNSFYNNTLLGIDLNSATDIATTGTSPYVTLNDNGDADTGANGLLNFPVFTSVMFDGGNLMLEGFAPSGVNVELYIADIDATVGNASVGDNTFAPLTLD